MRAVPPLAALALLAACSAEAPPLAEPGRLLRPIVGGTVDTGPAHGAVVALGSSTKTLFCSGTLIAPRVVLTAAHCLRDPALAGLRVGFGSDVDADVTWVPAVEYALHPDYGRTTSANDLGLVRLAHAPPAGIAPLPILPAARGLGPGDVGGQVTFVGFGFTELNTSGVKMQGADAIALVCAAALGCDLAALDPSMGWAPRLSFCYDQQPAGPCAGDSGGPALLVRDGREYVAGITSFGDTACKRVGCSTTVDAFEPFIRAFVGTPGPRLEGEPCLAASECQTGFCADGVCCDRACDGRGCLACAAAKGASADGVCTAVAAACDDGDPCTEGDGCSAGRCVGAPKSCPASPCREAAACAPTGECPLGALRPDGEPCPGGECRAGECAPPPGPDAGSDTATDAGGDAASNADAEAGPDAGLDGGAVGDAGTGAEEGGCGCGAGAAPGFAGLVALLALRRRRRA